MTPAPSTEELVKEWTERKSWPEYGTVADWLSAITAIGDRMATALAEQATTIEELLTSATNLAADFARAEAERDTARAALAVLAKGITAVNALICESSGVDGLHLNGDLAKWDDLRTGGRFETWLAPFDDALAALPPTPGDVT